VSFHLLSMDGWLLVGGKVGLVWYACLCCVVFVGVVIHDFAHNGHVVAVAGKMRVGDAAFDPSYCRLFQHI
jgi:hypothetical protein